MKKKKSYATRADVAKLAGVSVTVVSYVVNNNRYVETSKRARVLQAVEELHYQPNSIARALKGKNSNHIMFIADHLTNEYFSELMSHMDERAYEKGYLLSLCSNRNQENFVKQIISRHFDGIIISSISFPEKFILQLIEADVPVVLFKNRDYNNINQGAGIIDTGLYEAIRSGVQLLYQKSRRHILYLDRISIHNHFSGLDDFRLRGYVEQMQAFDLPYKDYIVTGCSTPEAVAKKVTDCMTRYPVDAIIGRNDSLAYIGLQTALRCGKRVPDDVAVIGYDNTSLSRYATPTLTTFEMQKDSIAKAAIEMIHKMRVDHEPPEPILFPAKLIERQST